MSNFLNSSNILLDDLWQLPIGTEFIFTKDQMDHYFSDSVDNNMNSMVYIGRNEWGASFYNKKGIIQYLEENSDYDYKEEIDYEKEVVKYILPTPSSLTENLASVLVAKISSITSSMEDGFHDNVPNDINIVKYYKKLINILKDQD